jgi:hypothetical protein
MGFNELWQLEIARMKWGWHHPISLLLLMVVVTAPLWLTVLWKGRR